MNEVRDRIGPEIFTILRFEALRNAHCQLVTIPEDMVLELTERRLANGLSEEGDIYISILDYVKALQDRFDGIQQERAVAGEMCDCTPCQYMMMFPFVDIATGKALSFLPNGDYLLASGSTLVYATEEEPDLEDPHTNLILKNADRVVYGGSPFPYEIEDVSGNPEVYGLVSSKFRKFFQSVAEALSEK